LIIRGKLVGGSRYSKREAKSNISKLQSSSHLIKGHSCDAIGSLFSGKGETRT
jgi:hypothetical protein